MNLSLVVDIPQDFDATSKPAATTTVYFTALLPARCPGDTFPLVLHSHGYGGSRITTLAADGTLHPEDAMFASMDELVQALPYHGYVVISFDERGHGESVPKNGGGYARIIDPMAETQDARAILDYAFDHAADLSIMTEPSTGIAKDIRVGSIGYSYGGGYQLPLALLDPRIDTLVPGATWHELLYSLTPGESVKLSFDGLLCLLATTGGVSNTPIVAALCNTVGVQGVDANNQRSLANLEATLASPLTQPRSVQATEITTFLDTHSTAYFERQDKANLPWGFGETSAHIRSVPTLLLQGNRDNLFNLTEAIWNMRYFASTGADVRLLSTEGGHMNPLAGQTEGTASCGLVQGVPTILAWFDHYLRGASAAPLAGVPPVCISVADTVGAPNVTPRGLLLSSVPVGSQTGTGGTPAKLDALSVSLTLGATSPTFVPVTTIHGAGQVLAGIPTIGSITIAAGLGAIQSTNAFVGVGIQRGTTTFLVDDQLTSLTAGTHTQNRNVSEDPAVDLPAIGETLQDGDVVGLLFYPQHIQYAAVVSAASLSGGPGIINTIGGTTIPPVTSSLEPGLGLTYLNPYTATATDIELPIVTPGVFPGSSLSQ